MAKDMDILKDSKNGEHRVIVGASRNGVSVFSHSKDTKRPHLTI